jgi:hypothetical protein
MWVFYLDAKWESYEHQSGEINNLIVLGLPRLPLNENDHFDLTLLKVTNYVIGRRVMTLPKYGSWGAL